MKKIFTEKACAPAGHYSQGILKNGFLFVSGQMGYDPVTDKIAPTVAGETTVALQNIKDIVEAAGGSITDIAKLTVFISDIGLWDEVNTAYAQFFGDHKPARAIIPCGSFGAEGHIEIEATAVIG